MEENLFVSMKENESYVKMEENYMAKFHKNLKKHADTVKKHEITLEELQFLKKIQKEMNTQDTVGQPNPRYWVIRDYEKIYGNNLNNPDGFCIYDGYGCETIYETEYKDMHKIKKEVIMALKNRSCCISTDDITAIKNCYDEDELKEVIEEIDSLCVSQFEIIPVDKGMFLTHKAAINHLKMNDYHYSDNAHTYAHTAWRSDEEKLWDILSSVDFDSLLHSKAEKKERAEATGWISVNDRLPDKAGSYLVVGKTGGATVTRWYKPSEYFPNGHFGGNSADYIRYWMPRPEAPED